MIVKRHILFSDEPDKKPTKLVFEFDPPVEVEAPLVSRKAMYIDVPGFPMSADFRKVTVTPPINEKGKLYIQEVAKPGDLISLVLRPKYKLQNLVLDRVHQMTITAPNDCLVYWFMVGRDGVFVVSGDMVKDDGIQKKLHSNQDDIPLHAYMVQRALADTEVTMKSVETPPDLMNTEQAAKYLGMSKWTLYDKARLGDIPRTRNKKFRKVDLDAYLQSSEKKGRRGRRSL
ncbi:MAG TPA: helix-turn-helix domain-containing protein [bacterium]|jgi:predicted DNA-binding transcriptional regulator AlpA